MSFKGKVDEVEVCVLVVYLVLWISLLIFRYRSTIPPSNE